MKSAPRQIPPPGSRESGLARSLILGTFLIGLMFGTMNLLSRHALDEASAVLSGRAATLDDETDEIDELEIFDETHDVQLDQPADSPGALPPEDAYTDNA